VNWAVFKESDGRGSRKMKAAQLKIQAVFFEWALFCGWCMGRHKYIQQVYHQLHKRSSVHCVNLIYFNGSFPDKMLYVVFYILLCYCVYSFLHSCGIKYERCALIACTCCSIRLYRGLMIADRLIERDGRPNKRYIYRWWIVKTAYSLPVFAFCIWTVYIITQSR